MCVIACTCLGSGRPTHALAHVILAAQQGLHLCPQGAVLPLQLLTCFPLLLQRPCQGQGPSLTLSALRLDPLALLYCSQDGCLLLRQELPGGGRWGGGNRLAERSVQGMGKREQRGTERERDRQMDRGGDTRGR